MNLGCHQQLVQQLHGACKHLHVTLVEVAELAHPQEDLGALQRGDAALLDVMQKSMAWLRGS